jgi:hypothetical protein
MATLKAQYSSELQITCNADALSSGASSGRNSTAIDNTANQYIDYLISGQVKSVNSSLGSNPTIFIYAYGFSYLGNYTDNVTGSDANFTIPSPTNLKLIGVAPYTVAQNVTLYIGPFSLAAAFGFVPGKWGIVVNNQLGVALAGSSGQSVSNTFSFVGVNLISI